jgi:uncharacterized protein YndB with AHSA1/START domain
MHLQISIARPAAEVYAFLANPANLRHWLPQLRREESSLPAQGLHADAAARRVHWSFAPAGEWRVTEAEHVSTLHLSLSADTAPATDPTEAETPAEAGRHGAEAALHSLKSHLERAGGGDPDLHTPDTASRIYGSSATQDPSI